MTTSETRYRLEAISGCTIISLLPDLNNVQWADIEQIGTDALSQLEKSSTPALLVDLSELEYMGSAMVALIVRLWKAVQKRGGRMVVVNRHQLVFEVLKLAGLHTVWTIVETRDEAFKKLRIRPAGDSNGNGAGEGGGVAAILLGVVALVGAVAGLLLILSPDKLVDDKVALAIELGSAALGLIVGAVIAAQNVGLRRGFGILVVLASLAVVAVGIVKRPDSFAPAPKQGDKAGGKSDNSNSKTKGLAKSAPKTKAATKPAPNTKSTAKPETNPKTQPAPKAKPKSIAKSVPKAKPVTKRTSSPKPPVKIKPKPPVKTKPKPTSSVKPKSTPKPTPKAKPVAKPKTKSTAKTKPATKPASSPKPTAKPKTTPKPKSKPTAKSKTPAKPVSTAKPKPTASVKPKPDKKPKTTSNLPSTAVPAPKPAGKP